MDASNQLFSVVYNSIETCGCDLVTSQAGYNQQELSGLEIGFS